MGQDVANVYSVKFVIDFGQPGGIYSPWAIHAYLKERRLRKISGAGSVNVVYGTLSSFSIGLAECGVKLLGESISALSLQ